MGLVNSIGEVIAELIQDGLYPGEVVLGDKLADEALQPGPEVGTG